MARLNEPPMSSDSLESLRRKMLRQNRDLAKSNNVRALRIRELENECACMLSENLELRGRILDLEKQVEDSESRRIADHALAIKAKLEAQLTEWGTLLAGLGLEPPIKKHSPRIRSSARHRMSFSSCRPSPSQRRLRDVAKDIEELGHISENKTHSRMSLNPEQILALRSEADAPEDIESPDLGPPPISQFIDKDPVKIDSPARNTPSKPANAGSTAAMRSPIALSPQSNLKTEKFVDLAQETSSISKTISPLKEKDSLPHDAPKQAKSQALTITQPGKAAGSKRKLGAREEPQPLRPSSANNENQTSKDKMSVLDKADGKTLKELTQIRKDGKTRPLAGRRPLAAKSTNNDMGSPQKAVKLTGKGEAPVLKPETKSVKTVTEAPKTRPAKLDTPLEVIMKQDSTEPSDLATPISEPVLLSPNSPERASLVDVPRGDTPPPADISCEGETSRPSRRNRTAISYAEPNLRDKMRRPSKQLFDAVTGEGKYSRRSSQSAPLPPDMMKARRESDDGRVLEHGPHDNVCQTMTDANAMPVSPLAHKSAPREPSPKPEAEEKPKRLSLATRTARDKQLEEAQEEDVESKETSSADVTSESTDIDPYEFTSSSPQPEKHELVNERRRSVTRASRSSRRFSTAEGDNSNATLERSSSRRRSMML